MNLIQRALDRPMSQGSPEIFPDLFGQFFTSLAISEVCRPPHFRSKSGIKIHCGNLKISQNYIFDSKITSTYRMTFWFVSADSLGPKLGSRYIYNVDTPSKEF